MMADPGGSGCTTTLPRVPRPGPVPRLVGAAGLAQLGVALTLVPAVQGAVVISFTGDRGLHLGDAVGALALGGALVVGAGARRPAGPPPAADGRPRDSLALLAVGLGLVAQALLGVTEVTQGSNLAFDLAVSLGAAAVTLAVALVLVPKARRHPAALVTPGRAACLAALVAGWVVDSRALPSGTVFGPAFLAAAVAASRPPGLRAHWAALVAGMLAVNVASLADIAGVDVLLARGAGGTPRTGALGAALAAGALGDHLLTRRRARR